MKKAIIISDVKALIKNAKNPQISKTVEYWQGQLDAYKNVLKAIENVNKPKRIFPSRELKIIK